MGGKVKADFCCHRGTLDSAKVNNLTMYRTNRGAEFLLKNVPYLTRGVGFMDNFCYLVMVNISMIKGKMVRIKMIRRGMTGLHEREKSC